MKRYIPDKTKNIVIISCSASVFFIRKGERVANNAAINEILLSLKNSYVNKKIIIIVNVPNNTAANLDPNWVIPKIV